MGHETRSCPGFEQTLAELCDQTGLFYKLKEKLKVDNEMVSLLHYLMSFHVLISNRINFHRQNAVAKTIFRCRSFFGILAFCDVSGLKNILDAF